MVDPAGNSSGDAAFDFKGIAFRVVEHVRASSNMSWSDSQKCAREVLGVLGESLGFSQLKSVDKCLAGDVLRIHDSVDYDSLMVGFDRIGHMHSDIQERTWTLHEEPEAVVEFLDKVEEIIRLSDSRVPLTLFQESAADTEASHFVKLVDLYQMEQRGMVRLALLRILISICRLDPSMADALLGTILPVEISRDLVSEYNKPSDFSTEKRMLSLKLISLLFCTGLPMPYQEWENFSQSRFYEVCAKDGATAGLHALLAVNLQFTPEVDVAMGVEEPTNAVLTACILAAKQNREFGQELVSLINKKIDPVWPFDDKTMKRSHSVLKLVRELLNWPKSATECFYSNDLYVLHEICIREITDLGLDPLRLQFLALLGVLIKNQPEDSSADISGVGIIMDNLPDPSSDEQSLINQIKALLL